MQSLKLIKPAQIENKSDAAILAESGVRRLSQETKDAIKAIQEARAKQHIKTANDPQIAEEKKTVQPVVPLSTPTPQDSQVAQTSETAQTVCPKMLERYMSLVPQVVAPIARRVPANVQRDDLLAAGLFGLVDSLRKNGSNPGVTFESYARMRIRGAVLDELRAQDWLSRRARDAINERADDPDAEREGVMLVGFDELSDAEEREHLVSYRLDPEAVYEAKETMRHLAAALDKLSERERTVVAMYYYESATFKKIAEKIEVSETRAFQIHARAIDRLKNVLLGKRSSRPTLREISLPTRNDAPTDDWSDSPPDIELGPAVA